MSGNVIEVKPLTTGELVDVINGRGERRAVAFVDVYRQKIGRSLSKTFRGLVHWPTAGDYDVNLETGQLMLKRTAIKDWHVGRRTLARMRATVEESERTRKGRLAKK